MGLPDNEVCHFSEFIDDMKSYISSPYAVILKLVYTESICTCLSKRDSNDGSVSEKAKEKCGR